MEVNNSLAATMTYAGSKAAYDSACRRLLAHKIILAWIMKSCIKEYQNCSAKEIAENYIEGTPQIQKYAVFPDEQDNQTEIIEGTSNEDVSINEGVVRYDIRFTAVAPKSGELTKIIINVEAQKDFYPGYPIVMRGLYYAARMISSQYGSEFKNSHYEKIKKVYSIWICTNPPADHACTITRYRIMEENILGNVKQDEHHYDLLSCVIICLGNSENERYTGIIRLMDVLLSDKIKPEQKKEILKEEFGIPMTVSMESEVQTMCNLSEQIEQEGIIKGRAEGKAEERMKSVFELMKTTGWNEQKAMDALNIQNTDRPEILRKLAEMSFS